MERLPLLGGAYSARSIIASATRCINYYPEINPKDSLVPMTYYQRAGLVPRASGQSSPPTVPLPVRGLYQASDGTCYAVIGQNFYQVTEGVGGALDLRLIAPIGAGTNPVSMIDNGRTLVIVDGSQTGWQYMLQAFSASTTANVYDAQTIDEITSTIGVAIGMTVSGANLPPDTLVETIPGATSITISKPGVATTWGGNASISGNTLTVNSTSHGNLLVGSVLIDKTGALVPNTRLIADLGGGLWTTDGIPQIVASEDMSATTGGAEAITFSAPQGFFAPITDPTNTFAGADKVDYIDSFLLWNMLNSTRFGSSLSGVVGFDPTQFASKTDYPDPLVTLFVNRHEILLFGRLKSEIWYNAGNPLFPFAELPGAYIEHGVVAKYSVASSDISVFWLGQDLQGQGIVFRQRGYQTTRISNHALERSIRRIAREAPSGITDAIGMTYQIEGHVFYHLTFPGGDETWVFDDSIADPMLAWHQEAWQGPDGQLRRHRANCAANFFGRNVVGDFENGTLYELDFETYSDTVDGVETPLVCIRTFPHIGQAKGPDGLLAPVNGRRIRFLRFSADIECGTAPVDVDGLPAQVTLRWSDDRGRTYGQDVLQSAGSLGEYLTQPTWPGLGIARDRIFELSHSIAGPAALNSAWIDGEILEG
jgi:hypothetical protein